MENRAVAQQCSPLPGEPIDEHVLVDVAVQALAITFIGHRHGTPGALSPEEVDAVLTAMIADGETVFTLRGNGDHAVERIELRIAQATLREMQDIARARGSRLYTVALDLCLQLLANRDHLRVSRDAGGHYWMTVERRPPYHPQALYTDAALCATFQGHVLAYTLAERPQDLIDGMPAFDLLESARALTEPTRSSRKKFPPSLLLATFQTGMFASLLSANELSNGPDTVLLAIFEKDLKPREVAAVAQGTLEFGVTTAAGLPFLTLAAYGTDGEAPDLTFDAPYHPKFDRDPAASMSTIGRLREAMAIEVPEIGGGALLLSDYDVVDRLRVSVMLCDYSSKMIEAERLIQPSQEWIPWLVHILSTAEEMTYDRYRSIITATYAHFPSPIDIHNATRKFVAPGSRASSGRDSRRERSN